jgi:hypothetical protein
MKLSTFLLSGLVLAIPLSGWIAFRAANNLSGKCASLGRTLTTAEKRSKLVGFLQEDNAPANVKDGSSVVQTIFSRTEKNYPGSDDFSVIIHNNANESTADFWVYPDVPIYALNDNGEYDNVAFKSSKNLNKWVPVTFWYRSTGYASDLVFLDLRMTGTFKDGRTVPKKYDYRAWMSSCGKFVELPKEFWEH